MVVLAGGPALADDLAALRAQLDLETLDVVAHSAGARVALAWAAAHPDRVGRLCLVTPPAGWLMDVPSDTDELVGDRRDEPWYAAYRQAQPALAAVTTYAEFLLLAHVVAPLGWAEWDDRARAHEQDASLFSNGTAVTIPDAGHYPWLEQPDGFHGAVAPFLRQ